MPDPYYDEGPYDPYYEPPFREPEPEQEREYLEGVVKHLEKELDNVRERMKELDAGAKEKKK